MGLYDDCPCNGCEKPKRHIGCHSHCPDKAKWDKKTKATKDAILTEQKRNEQATSFLVESQLRVAKRLKINNRRWR